MATSSTAQVPKRKKQVYGKVVNRSHWNVDSFFNEDDEPASAESVPPRQSNVKESYPVTKAPPKTYTSKQAPSRPKRHDTFDVPSSDEDSPSPAKVVPSPRFHHKSTLVDDTAASHASLAPWERSRAQADHDATSKRKNAYLASPESQLREDLMRATASPELLKSTTPSRKSPSEPVEKSRAAPPEPLTAKARLAARRREAGHPVAKRDADSDPDITPRKRARTSEEAKEGPSQPTGDESTHESAKGNAESDDQQHDIFDLPSSSEEERSSQSNRLPSSKLRSTKPSARPGRSKTYAGKAALAKGASAPSRLTEMLHDTDTTEAPTRSPSATSRKSSPQHAPSTPPSGRSANSETNNTAAAAMTPRQAQLWHDLLPSDNAAPSPSALPIKDLSISGKKRSGVSSFTRKLSKSQSDVGRRRTRLVDRLKASAPSSGDEALADDDSESESESMDDLETKQRSPRSSERPSLVKRVSSHTSHSQSQPTAAASTNGPKITYGQSRSYLQEDSLEQDFMADLDSEMTQRPAPSKRFGKSTATLQNSAFDLEDSDDERTSGKIRTIHELRASGRNVAGMYDIEELLGEIRNHNASHRSRRRSALIELASKLTDKAFAGRFVGQSLESELAAECGVAADDIADFAIAVAFAVILASEPPDHTIRTLHEQGTLPWLAKLLQHDPPAGKMAKDRRNNMAKAAQGAFNDFTDGIKTQVILWGERVPHEMTPRLIALKALDLLIRRLRRTGTKEELLDFEQISLVLRSGTPSMTADHAIDLDLSVSILESLSTTTTSLSWPSTTLERIADILPQLDATTSTTRHTLFLTLRLSLNLTNDNAHNCALLSANPMTTQHLLLSIDQGCTTLHVESNEEHRALALDLLVLSMGIIINLAEHSTAARHSALLTSPEVLTSLLAVLQTGQENMLEAESVSESVTNVAYGYLAVMLANLCQEPDVRAFVKEKLPGKNLRLLVEAVQEFVLHHERVDGMAFEGEEGGEVWGAFTERLRGVLGRLKEVE
ncbi:hypothetical protein BDY17DRAFT_134017 [Neohortaea acidophila]|uniref:Wings apart-like protein C-terminal domain-containing protein n=1 Tax=Neohortaea acidophila TaxID=245834 RepID=A0A6A6PY58_9PEZI|nr:uncharacterized protein BDY17DRAFT_134017 [Neohortaea acidophila]KAF2484706.1 hypothetical protein BDY17DRAFT_134017 [Neohortaea acidophila]